jgi:pimeloyl-ACP methyl ester carboxylesterase
MSSLVSFVVFGALALGIGIFVYVVASFALMRAHVEARPFRHELRAALEETYWATLTQPLLPLWYLFGRRMGGHDGGDGKVVPVIFVHGYFQNRVGFLGLARTLSRRHGAPLYGFNYPWTDEVPRNAARLDRFIEEVCKERGCDKVDLVCHSLGGVVALEYMHEHMQRTGGARVRRCVTVASPHAGVAYKGPIIGSIRSQLRRGCAFFQDRAGRRIGVPCLSIYSTHDNVVHPPMTSALNANGGRDLVIEGKAHLSLLFTPRVHDEIVGFLSAESVETGALPQLDVAI